MPPILGCVRILSLNGVRFPASFPEKSERFAGNVVQGTKREVKDE
jgi:hypothetical protein